MRLHVLLIASLAAALGCASNPTSDAQGGGAGSSVTTPTSLILSTLYVNRSAEYDANCMTVYSAASAALLKIVLHGGALSGKAPAVILDVDETVLDNSPYEVRLIEDGARYPTGWDEWCMEEEARPVPGVAGFLELARTLDVQVFFVTNRKAHLEEATRNNLVKFGLLGDESVDTVLLRGEREEWTNDKSTRRSHVASSFDVVMLVGDNLRDFYEPRQEEPDSSERAASLANHRSRWGHDWFMLPNPMYGGWDEAAIGHDFSPGWNALDTLRVQDLDPMRDGRSR